MYTELFYAAVLCENHLKESCKFELARLKKMKKKKKKKKKKERKKNILAVS